MNKNPDEELNLMLELTTIRDQAFEFQTFETKTLMTY